jgi:hypothetical protein
MIGSKSEGKLYFQLSHQVFYLEKLRKQHNVSSIDFDNILQSLFAEERRKNVENQGRLF